MSKLAEGDSPTFFVGASGWTYDNRRGSYAPENALALRKLLAE